MRQYLIATIDRRPGAAFKVMDESGKALIGTMHLNGEKAQHEMLLSEADFLWHNKALALLQRRVGVAVFVAAIRETEETKTIKTDQAFANMPFFTLRAMAKASGVDISDCADSEERAARINAATVNA